ncbi:polysaccharide pyruvyl transferase family protein [Pseudidiomarina homiensis]|uniref:polysaccharide pyruvyl transferase family protein n=1 Tax=Pseudidiomarina homiensis TaxID=364198 RepID=UPI00215ACC79|nr:polysaccharide pyruvyl transferase family protein [Pseudidiomarina homiensis]
MLTIEIKGIGFNNKGAELMLSAVIDHFKVVYPDVRFVVEPPVSRRQLKHFELMLKARYLRKGYNTLQFLNIFPKFILHKLSIVKSSEVNIVLDASGYGYGDPWAPGIIKNKLALEINRLKSTSIPLILLPQAFGPFEKKAVKTAFLPIYNNADLLFARDEASLKYLSDLGVTQAEVKQSPDFTNLVTPTPYLDFKPSLKSICLIPNLKMLRNTKVSKQYLQFCRETLVKTRNEGFEPFILVHEKAEDTALAKQLLNGLDEFDIPVVTPNTAKECKWVIGQSHLVISSRFHGLVNALSQGIPSFATSWSHKYQALLADYEHESYLIDLNKTADEVSRVLSLLKDSEKMTQIRNHLQTQSIKQKELTRKMWKQVEQKINQLTR